MPLAVLFPQSVPSSLEKQNPNIRAQESHPWTWASGAPVVYVCVCVCLCVYTQDHPGGLGPCVPEELRGG